MSEERKHHRYSPSSLQMREVCSCWDNRGGTSEAAETGTRQHSVTETGLDDESLSDEAALHAADALDFAERQRTLLVEERQRAQAEVDVPLAEVIDLVEVYLPVDDLKFDDGCVGTTAGYVDRAFISWDRKHAVMVDHKFGLHKVTEAADNLQSIAYALGLFRAYPTVDEIKFYFRMPALDLTLDTVYTRAMIPDLYLRVSVVVARAREAHRKMATGDFSDATPTTPCCLFCAHIATCPKVAELACKVGSKFFPVEIPNDISPTGLLSGPDTSMGIRLAQVVAVWAKSFRASISDRVIRGDAPMPPGFRVESRSDREIVDVDKFKETALKYLTVKELESAADYTFGKIEKQISAQAPRGQKKQTVEEFQDALIASGAVKRGDSYSFLKFSGE